MYGDCRKMKLRIRRIPWFTRISWFNCHWKNLTLRSRETPGVFGGSGKGSLPKWRKATKLVVQMVLHFFLYVFIYLHFGKLIDIAMEWVLWRISYWPCVYSIATLYSLPEVPLLMRYLGFFHSEKSKILNKNPTEIDFELRSSWLAMACRYLVSWCWMGIRVHVVWSIWSTGAMAWFFQEFGGKNWTNSGILFN